MRDLPLYDLKTETQRRVQTALISATYKKLSRVKRMVDFEFTEERARIEAIVEAKPISNLVTPKLVMSSESNGGVIRKSE